MRVDVISNVNEARSDDFIHKTVVVIDVLRATSAIVTGLEHGCTGIVPVETVSQARALKQSDDLLAGERFCKKIAGFDLGNSPLEYRTPDIAGKRMIMTTTNGTRVIQKVQKGAHILAGSVLNAECCARSALHFRKDIVLVCAGTQDDFALEDGLCAGLLVDELQKRMEAPLALNDSGMAMLAAYRHRADDLQGAMAACSSGMKLSKLGFERDIAFCSQLNLYDTVPLLQNQTLVPMRF